MTISASNTMLVKSSTRWLTC